MRKFEPGDIIKEDGMGKSFFWIILSASEIKKTNGGVKFQICTAFDFISGLIMKECRIYVEENVVYKIPISELFKG